MRAALQVTKRVGATLHGKYGIDDGPDDVSDPYELLS